MKQFYTCLFVLLPALMQSEIPALPAGAAGPAQDTAAFPAGERIDLSPAKWIWLPSQRTLPNTFVLFRREINLPVAPRKAVVRIAADSRYRLFVNGSRAGWGPGPADPRAMEVDALDLTKYLKAGANTLGAEVLYYGQGDGTYALGKPGFIFKMEAELEDGSTTSIVSDAQWQSHLDRSHPPGQYKRWFLRALQEQFDARLQPKDWASNGFSLGKDWQPAMLLPAFSDKPAACSGYPEYAWELNIDPAQSALISRAIPPLREELVPPAQLAASGMVTWHRDPEDWFQFRIPGSFTAAISSAASDVTSSGCLLSPATDQTGMFAMFEWKEQGVGWPVFTIDAPEGAIVDVMCQEAHDPASTPWLDTQYYNWSRLTCREGLNTFEPFDFESFRWLQLHVRNANRPVRITQVAMRRRSFPWPAKPQISCSDPVLQQLFGAAVNTIVNSAQETCVDGMARERQQYSGDGGHQLTAIRYAFAETRLPRRFLHTFAGGQQIDGYFLDCWPAWDRQARLIERQIHATGWGPILDHGIGFNFDCWNHYMETGDIDSVRPVYPRLVRFAEYLKQLRDTRGDHDLLPVENVGVPSVWVDHDAFRQQRHKQCAFNLYAAAMLQHAVAPMGEALGKKEEAGRIREMGRQLEQAVVKRFWSAEKQLFINNLPWLAEEKEERLDDRSLATAILFGQCPDGNTSAVASALAAPPPSLGISYPCNAGWRYSALVKAGYIRPVLHDFRTRWATMRSVQENNTLQEYWTVRPDSPDQWSHSAVAPLNVLYTGILGLIPIEPGFKKAEIRPCLGDMEKLSLTAHVPQGPVHFAAVKTNDVYEATITLPPGLDCDLVTGQGNSLSRTPLKAGKQVVQIPVTSR